VLIAVDRLFGAFVGERADTFLRESLPITTLGHRDQEMAGHIIDGVRTPAERFVVVGR
jgi:hypothetical protein